MAKRVSDHIMCIDGRYVDRYGTPEEVFTDQYVSGLFGITAGSFDETGEDLELEKPDGRTRVFVIAGGGLGRKSFRSLQRKGIPFATGIIYEMIWIILRQRRFLLRLSVQEALSL